MPKLKKARVRVRMGKAKIKARKKKLLSSKKNKKPVVRRVKQKIESVEIFDSTVGSTESLFINTPKNNFSFSFKPFSIIKNVVIFAFIIFSLITLGNFLSKYQISENNIIKNIAIKQTSAIITEGKPVKWSIIVKRSDIKNNQYLVKLPKTADNIKIKNITRKEAKTILSKSIPQARVSLTMDKRRELVATSNRSPFLVTKIISKVKNFFLASLNDSIDQPVETAEVTEGVIETNDALLVDLSDQAPAEQIIEQPVEEVMIEEEQILSEPESEPEVSIIDELIPDVTQEQEQPAEVISQEEVAEEIVEEIIEEILPQDDQVSDEQLFESEDSSESERPVEEVMIEEVLEQQMEVVSPEEAIEEVAEEITSEPIESTEPIIEEPTVETVSSSESSGGSQQEQQITEAEIIETTETTETTETQNSSSEEQEFVQIEFETPAPQIIEKETKKGKIVTVSDLSSDSANDSLVQLNLTNVTAFTTIPEIFKVGQEKNIQVKWQNNGNQDMPFSAHDLNQNGKLDYIEWTVPHLSEQTFEVIFISKAFYLDENKNIIEDIYEKVSFKDNNYATVTNGKYARITFESFFTNQNGITLYAKSADPNVPAKIEVYPLLPDGSSEQVPIATFENIGDESFYKVDLTNLQTPTDVFDLKFIGNAEIDYIVDSDFNYSPNKILTPSGYKNLSELKIGDEVVGYNNGSQVVNIIENIQFTKPDAYDHYEQDAKGNDTEVFIKVPFIYYLINEKWELYTNQSIYTSNGVVHAFELQVGDTIYDTTGQPVTITSVRSGEDRIQWMSLTVSGNHSYVADDLLLHNASRYWVGGGASVNWNATSNTNWGSASNTQDNSSVPVSTDDVFFDGVGTGASDSTLSANKTIRSLNMTGYVNILTHNSSITLSIGDATAGASDIALKLVSGMTYTLGNGSSSAISFISTSTTVQTVDFAGKTSGDVTYNGTGGSWQMTGTHNGSSGQAALTLTKGTLDTNGQTISMSTFDSDNSNTRVLTLGASALTFDRNALTQWDITTTTGLTFTANTASITLSGTTPTFTGGGLTYGGTVSLTGSGTATITDSNTFANLTRTGTAVKTSVFQLNADQTVTGTLTLSGNSAINRLLVNSNTVGTARTITNTGATMTWSNVDFRDITLGTAYDASGITGKSGDVGGNTNITFTTAANQYWKKGSSANWSASNWFTTSGGSTAGRVPLPQDTAIFDANSVTAGSVTITQDMSRIGSVDFTGVTNTPTFTISVATIVNGSMTLVSGMTITESAGSTFTGRGSYTLTTAGLSTTRDKTLNAPGGTLTLQDNFTTTGDIFLTNGTFNANNFDINAGGFFSNNSNTRVLTMGSGTFTLTGAGTDWAFATTTNLTLNANTSTIKFTNNAGSTMTFAGGGMTYNNVWFSRGANTSSITITGSNTFNNFKDDGSAAHSILFTAGTTTTVTTWTVVGTSGNEITINSNTTATHALTKSGGGVISSDYLNIQHSVASPANTWYAGANSTDNQATATAGSGWTFTNPTDCISLATGNWNTAGTWDCGHVPTTSDTVTVAASHTVTMDVDSAVLVTITVNGTLNTSDGTSRALSGTTLTIASGGTLTANASTITLSGTTGTSLSNSGTFTVNTSTVAYTGNNGAGNTTVTNITYYNLTLNNSSETYVLGATTTVSNNLTITAGTLDTVSGQNYGLNVGGNWSNSGTFTERSGTVTFNGSAAQTLTGETFYDLTINNTHASPDDSNDVDSSAAVTVTNTLTVTDGQFQPTTASDFATVSIGANGLLVPDSSADITVSGDWTNSGTFTDNSGTVTFDGTTQNLTSGGTGTGQDFNNLTYNKISGTLTLVTNAIDVDGTLRLTLGTLSPGALNITAGTLTMVGGNFTGGSGNLDINGNFSMSLGTFIAPDSSGAMTISGNFDHGGATFTHNSGTVTFDGSVAQTLTGATFNNLIINNSYASPDDSNDVDSSAAVTVASTLTVTDGQFQPTTASDFNAVSIGAAGILKPDSGADITVSGSWSNSGAFTANSGTVTLTGTSTFSDTTSFYNLTINGSGKTVTLGAALNITNALTITAGTLDASTYTITLSGTGTVFSNSGTFTAGSSTISLTDTSSTSKTFAGGGGTYNTLSITGAGTGAVIITGSNTFSTFTINPPKTITFTISTTQTITGTFSCTGTSGNVITINSSSAGNAATLSKSSGTVSCDYLSVQDSAATGGATWNPGSNSTSVSGNSGWVFNSAPSITAGPSDNGVLTSPTNAGSDVTFTATATDSDADAYYLAICKTDSITAVNSAAPTCGGGSWAISTSTASGVQASVTYTTVTADSESNAWYGFVCDNNSGSLCSSSSQGGIGSNGSPFQVNHIPTFTAISNTSGSISTGSAVTFTTTASDADTDTTADTVTLYVCKSNDFTGTACGSAGTWCSSSASSSDPTCSYTIQSSDGSGSQTYYGYIIDNHSFASTSNPRSSTFTSDTTVATPSVSGGGGIYPPPSVVVTPPPTIVEQITQIPEVVVEIIKEIPSNISAQAKKITEQISEIQKQIAELIRPAEKPTEIVVVPKETPLAFETKWNLLPVQAIKRFVLSPLPTEIKVLTQKFPELEKTFENVGISKITDVQKLTNTNLKIPGLTQTVGLAQVEISPGKFAPPKGIPIANLSLEARQKIPTEIVFAKTAGGLVDYNTVLSINNKGRTEQTIKTISGKPLQLVVKPDKPVKIIKGYIIFKSKKPRPTSFQIPLNYLTASLVFASPDLTEVKDEPIVTENKLVLLEFEYTDPDGDGIYTANIDMPVVDGEYEIITVMDYQDERLISKQITLITVVDPEGYIYEKDGDKETRILGAVASLYWLNPETKQYELWPAKDYQQENPQTTDVRGTYSFLVAEGYYYLKVDAPGYLSYDGKPFQVQEGGGVHINIELKTKYWWTKIIDWKVLLLITIVLLLLYNFYRDKMRERTMGVQNKI